MRLILFGYEGHMMFSLAVLGGVLLNIGAFLMFRGLAFQAII